MDGEEREFETIADAGLVVDGAQVIFDDLLSGLEAHGDLAIFATLDDERDDTHFSRCEAVADARAYEIVFGRLGHHELRRRPGVACCDATDALDQSRSSDVAED